MIKRNILLNPWSVEKFLEIFKKTLKKMKVII